MNDILNLINQFVLNQNEIVTDPLKEEIQRYYEKYCSIYSDYGDLAVIGSDDVIYDSISDVTKFFPDSIENLLSEQNLSKFVNELSLPVSDSSSVFDVYSFYNYKQRVQSFYRNSSVKLRGTRYV